MSAAYDRFDQALRAVADSAKDDELVELANALVDHAGGMTGLVPSAPILLALVRRFAQAVTLGLKHRGLKGVVDVTITEPPAEPPVVTH